MSMFPRLRQHEPEELQSFFMGDGEPEVPEDERELWLQEVAIQIAKTGTAGIKFLLSRVPEADEARLRAILLAMSFVKKRLSSRQRAEICEIARSLLTDKRPMVVAEAVDTLASLSCRAAEDSIYPLLKHASPYVVGSALRFFARQRPKKAVPLLLKALDSEEPIIRQNAVDELDEMNYKRALDSIRRLLDDPDEDVREAAHWAVTHLQNGSL